MKNNRDLGKYIALVEYDSTQYTPDQVARRVVVPYLQRMLNIHDKYGKYYEDNEIHENLRGVTLKVRNKKSSKGLNLAQFALTEGVRLRRLANQAYYLESLRVR